MKFPYYKWLSAAVIISALCGLIYVAVQQSIRSGANDPQIEISENIVSLMGQGESVENILGPNKTPMGQPLGAFVIIYDDAGKPLGSSMTLDGQIPVVPIAALQYAKAKGRNMITWQPRQGIRNAIVIAPYSGKASGYVVVGRSLREIEKREDMLLKEVAAVWLGSLAVLAGTMFVSGKKSKQIDVA